LTRLFSEAPLLALCGQNIRRVKKKIYGPLDLVSHESQTDASDNDLAQVQEQHFVDWKTHESQTDEFVQWRATVPWLNGWHVQARTKACDMVEVELGMYFHWCEERDGEPDGNETETLTTADKGEAVESKPLNSDEIIVNEKQERKLLRAWKNSH
jgi:hypothetical protein